MAEFQEDEPTSIRPVRGRSTAALRNQPLWLRIVGSIVAVAAAFALSIAAHLPQQGYTFLLLYPVVIASAYFAGRDAGLSATAAAATLVGGRMLISWNSERDLLLVQVASLLLFVAIGAGSSILLSRLKHALRQLELSNEQLVTATESARAASAETDLLLRELRHRIRNDLSNLIAILRMQAKSLDGNASLHLISAAERLQVLAKVHQRLARQGHQPIVEMKEFVEELCSELKTTLLPLKPVKLDADVENVALASTRAVAVGLIINELVTNAIKYAYPDERDGTITVYLACEDGIVEVGVEDDGVGIEAAVDGEETASSQLGHRLVRNLAAQLGGRFLCDPSPPGTSCIIAFPLEAHSAA